MHASRKAMAKGFTLVEILIVVVILGILAAIVVPQFTNAANDARDGNIATQVSTIESQVELWAAQNNGSYPALQTSGSGSEFSDLVTAGFFKDLPVNPYTGASTVVTNAGFDGSTPSLTVFTIANSTDGWVYHAASGNISAIQP